MPPVISALVYTVTDSTIVATWTTDISSDSNLSAGGKAAIDNGVAANSTSHQCIVTGLLPSTVYSCVVTSGGTSSTPQNVTTNAAQTRTIVTRVAIGNNVTRATVHGDTFYNFVSNDNNTYCIEDDGFGFVSGTPNAGANMQIGKLTNETTMVGTLVNLLTAYGGFATSNGTDGPGGTALTNKLCGLFGMAGSLYAFQVRDGLTGPAFQSFFSNIMRSTDHGATWNSWQNPAVFNANGIPPSPLGSSMFTDPNIGWVTPCRYAVDDGTLGYNTAGNQIDGANGYVYLVFTDGHWNDGSALYLMRVPRIQMQAQSTSAFQYWNGTASPTPADFVNDANWSNSSSSKVAIYSAASQASAPGMVFIPALNTYLLQTWYNVGGSLSNTQWTILAAPTPAGPWVSVATRNWNPEGYYNPVALHRTVATNVLTNSIPLRTAFSGDYSAGGTGPYYYPTTTSLTLFTDATPPVSVVNFAAGGNTASVISNSTTPSFVSTKGNTLVAAVRIGSTSGELASVTTTAGEIFTLIPGSVVTNNSNGQTTMLLYLENIAGNAAEVITATFTHVHAFCAVCVWEIAGLQPGSLDTSANAHNESAGTTVTSGAFTTTKKVEIVCVFGGLPTTDNVYTSGAGYIVDGASIPVGAGKAYCGASHIITSNVLTAATAQLTGTASGSGSTISVASFIAAVQPSLATFPFSPVILG